ncbi:30S ribosomal protein S9 [bacterium]|nr:30S ribosomal protein S9 [bacterium]
MSPKTKVKKRITTEVKVEPKKKAEPKKREKPKYFEAIGRRKTSVARVRLFTQGEKGITINDKPYRAYFPIEALQKTVEAPLKEIKSQDKFKISIKVRGGGLSGQAEACRHGIARALVVLNPLFKKRLRKAGFLTRDPRMRERKKFGLKRARRAPQWSKR